MSRRHAAAFALVGWYLMVPPPEAIQGRVDFKTYSLWDVIDRYDRIQDCKTEQQKDQSLGTFVARG